MPWKRLSTNQTEQSSNPVSSSDILLITISPNHEHKKNFPKVHALLFSEFFGLGDRFEKYGSTTYMDIRLWVTTVLNLAWDSKHKDVMRTVMV